MRLTVIIPLYNHEQFIETTLLSLLRQRDACDLDILVVNDGSTDAGPNRAANIANRFGHIRMITTENQGIAKTRNVGLDNIPDDADFVSFLDSDDISPTNRIRDDLEPLVDDPSLQFTYGKITLVDCLDDDAFEPAAEARTATVRGISLSAGIFRATFLREIGSFE